MVISIYNVQYIFLCSWLYYHNHISNSLSFWGKLKPFSEKTNSVDRGPSQLQHLTLKTRLKVSLNIILLPPCCWTSLLESCKNRSHISIIIFKYCLCCIVCIVLYIRYFGHSFLLRISKQTFFFTELNWLRFSWPLLCFEMLKSFVKHWGLIFS